MTPSPLRGWRGRLLAAFLLVAVPPLLVLAAFVFALVSERLDRNDRGRLDSGVRAVARRLEEQQRRAAAQVAAAAREDLPSLPADPESARLVATVISERRDLPLVEVVGADGRVLSSHHWPAAVGLPERDRPFSRRGAFRLETVGQGYGAAERLAVTASTEVDWAGQRVTLRGGYFIDGPDLGDLAELMGVDVALRDAARGRWTAPDGSLLARWADPDIRVDRRQGDAVADGTALWWAAAPVEPGLWAVVGVPRTLLAEVTGGLRRLTLVVALLAALAAFATALLLSARIAGPVRDLAAGAHRVAAGDLAARVPVTAADEVGDLARAFNAMTAELQVLAGAARPGRARRGLARDGPAAGPRAQEPALPHPALDRDPPARRRPAPHGGGERGPVRRPLPRVQRHDPRRAARRCGRSSRSSASSRACRARSSPPPT